MTSGMRITIRTALLTCVLGGCGAETFGAEATEVGILPQSAKIQGRDGGPSGVVWGRSVWTFGDTVLDVPDQEGQNWHHNSFSTTQDRDATDGITGFEERLDGAGAPSYFISPTPDEASFNKEHRGDPCKTAPCGARWAVWPGPPIWDEPRKRALIFYGLIYAEPGDFNFHGVGQSVAIWTDVNKEPERPVIAPGTEHPTLLFGKGEPPWGSAALIEDGQLHAFACDSDGDGFSPPCYLARVDPAAVTVRSAWRFWDGSGWSADAGAKVSLFSGAPSLTVARNAHLGKWTAIYGRPLSNQVLIRTADALTGPWSEAKLLFTASKDPEGAYDANWHPEFDRGAELYVTYSRSNHKGWFGAEFVLERVTLP